VIGIATTFPIGALADRLGPRRTMVAVCAWRAVGFACYTVIHGFAAFMILTCLLGVAGKAAMTSVRQALVGRAVLREARVRTMAVTQAVRNAGYGLGSLLALAFVQANAHTSYNLIVLINAASFVAAGVLAAAVRERHQPGARAQRGGSPVTALGDRGYAGMALLNTVLLLNQSALTIAIPLWALDHTQAPRAIVPAFLTVNTVLIALAQVRASKFVTNVASAVRLFMVAGAFLALAAGLVAAASAVSAAAAACLLILGVTALTCCELLQGPASWQLSYAFAPDETQSAHLALFGMGTAVEQAVGPYALTAGVIAAGVAGWAGFGAVACCAALLLPPVVRSVKSRHTAATGPVPLKNRTNVVTCGSSGYQAALAYSLIRPPRTGFRRIRLRSRSAMVRWPSSCLPSGTRWAIP
jgi:hypothetical protein